MGDPEIKQPNTGETASIPFNEVLELLAQDQDIRKQLSQLAALLALRFHEDPDDLRQILWVVLCDNIHTLRDLKSLNSWARRTLTRYCINLYRHRKVEARYREKEKNERQNVQFIRRSADDGDLVFFRNMVLSPEELLIEKERTEMLARRAAELRVRVRLTLTALTPSDARIAWGWIEGMTLQQIARDTGRPVSTVQRRLFHHVQQRLIDELELEQNFGAKLLVEGLRELLIRSLIPELDERDAADLSDVDDEESAGPAKQTPFSNTEQRLSEAESRERPNPLEAFGALVGELAPGSAAGLPSSVRELILGESAAREYVTQRYRTLIDRKYLHGLSANEKDELAGLETTLDKMDEPYYETIVRRLQEMTKNLVVESERPTLTP